MFCSTAQQQNLIFSVKALQNHTSLFNNTYWLSWNLLIRQRMLWQKITHFPTVEVLETAQHMWIYEQYNSKYMCSQDTHKPLLPWEVKGKGLRG